MSVIHLYRATGFITETYAFIEKFRLPNLAYAKRLGYRGKARWYKIRKNSKGQNYIMLKGFRVYEENWRYAKDLK